MISKYLSDMGLKESDILSNQLKNDGRQKDWREFIRKMAEDDNQVNKYFNRLINADFE